MPGQLVVSLEMLGIVLLGYAVAWLVVRIGRYRMPDELRTCGRIMATAVLVFRGIDFVGYAVGAWPLPRALQWAQGIGVVLAMLWVIARLVRFLSTSDHTSRNRPEGRRERSDE